jgi:hypothetical protein
MSSPITHESIGSNLPPDALESGRDSLGATSLAGDISLLSTSADEFCATNGDDWLTAFNTDLVTLTEAAELSAANATAADDVVGQRLSSSKALRGSWFS